jgi:hypothetical protein
LVIFVSNSQPLLKRLASVGATNLCGITGAMLLNWARKGERPPAATQQLQTLMRTLTERKSTQRSNSRIQDAAVGKTGASASQLTGTPGTSELESLARTREITSRLYIAGHILHLRKKGTAVFCLLCSIFWERYFS